MNFCIDKNSLSDKECFWLNDVTNLVTSLFHHYGAITLDKLSQDFADTTIFEKELLGADNALIREITLSGKSTNLIYARTAILKETYDHFTTQLDTLNDKPIGDNLLFDKSKFIRDDFIIRKIPTSVFLDEIQSPIDYKGEFIYSRSSVFTYKESTGLKFLITEYFLVLPESIHIQPNTKLQAYMMLMRLHRPIPILLILWPTLTALVLAAHGIPDIKLLVIFTIGVVTMCSVGCVVNDMADIDIDRHVARTSTRPLTCGKLTMKDAYKLCALLTTIAFICVSFLNIYTIALSFIAMFLAVLYPFCKRFFALPQLVLGLAFNFGILMAFSATTNHIPLEAWVFYLATICWTVAYDTVYALADMDYDIEIGVKSSAVLFGENVFKYIFLFNGLAILFLVILGAICGFSYIYYIALIISTVFFIRNYFSYKKLGITNCIKAFSDNHWVGLILFIAVLISFVA
jgi:4-hydroxybenzoate polyprenyltransferase